MRKYRFHQNTNQKIVDGILQGYKNYIQERNEKKISMKISDAYAWVKGNHIDDQTAKECEDLGIEYSKAKAGYSWGYLRFISSDDRSMFIIKNGKYFNEDNFPGSKDIYGKKKRKNNEDNYLKQLSKINQNVKFPNLLSQVPDENSGNRNELLTLFDDNILKSLENTELTRLQNDFNKFYIITYEIDLAFMISSIKVWIPNPEDNVAYEVEDLTNYIKTSTVELGDIDTTVLESDTFEYEYESPTAYDFDIFHEEDLDQEDIGEKNS